MKDPYTYTITELKTMSEQRGLSATGTKDEMISRLMEADPDGDWLRDDSDKSRDDTEDKSKIDTSLQQTLQAQQRENALCKREKELAERELEMARREIQQLRNRNQSQPQNQNQRQRRQRRSNNDYYKYIDNYPDFLEVSYQTANVDLGHPSFFSS